MEHTGSNSDTTTHGVMPCPYCGHIQRGAAAQCDSCGGLFEPLSRQATQNAMGAWFIRDDEQPHRPGCSYETLRKLVLRGKVTEETVLRGPTTRQFWSYAKDTPGVAHLMGQCHNCHEKADPDEYMCKSCGAVFVTPSDRQHLGLAPKRLLPGQAPSRIVAASTISGLVTPTETKPPEPARTPQIPTEAPSAGPPASLESFTSAPTPAPTADIAPPEPPRAPMTASMKRMRKDVARFKTLAAMMALSNIALLALVCVFLLWPFLNGLSERATESRTQTAQTPAISGPVESTPATPTSESSEPSNTGPAESALEQAKTSRFQRQFDAALELADEDSLDAVAKAIQQLREIEAEALPGEAPEGLADEIDRLEERHEELALREFM